MVNSVFSTVTFTFSIWSIARGPRGCFVFCFVFSLEVSVCVFFFFFFMNIMVKSCSGSDKINLPIKEMMRTSDELTFCSDILTLLVSFFSVREAAAVIGRCT